jgi:GNAT superfamily N-acetyltransferase
MACVQEIWYNKLIDHINSYELQITSSVQGQGIGRVLMQELEKIAKQWHMMKIMLTVLKSK